MLKEEKWMFRLIGALSVKENHKVLRKAFRASIKAVREDCAKVADDIASTGVPDWDCGTAMEIAKIIRRK